MPLRTQDAPLGYTWVITFTHPDDKKGVITCSTHFNLAPVISALILQKARDIIITDATQYRD